MLGGLHDLLLSLAFSTGESHPYRVSHVKEKITKLGSWGLYEDIIQVTSATVVMRLLTSVGHKGEKGGNQKKRQEERFGEAPPSTWIPVYGSGEP
jgi:hypothetical protein